MDSGLAKIVEVFYGLDGLKSARFAKKTNERKKRRWCFAVLSNPQIYAREEVQLAQAHLSQSSTCKPEKSKKQKQELRKKRKLMRKNKKGNR